MGIIKNIEWKKSELQKKIVRDAFSDALNISKILVDKFGANEVILYGSLKEKKYFDMASDIDLAVKGLKDNYFRAYGYCLRNCRFNLDIKAYEDLPQEFKEIVDKRGLKLNE